MEEQRQNPGGNRRRRRNKPPRRPALAAAPVLIAARRPDSPLLQRPAQHNVAASARPSNGATANRTVAGHGAAAAPGTVSRGDAGDTLQANGTAGAVNASSGTSASAVRRSARIVQTLAPALDDRERLRLRLLERLSTSEGQHTISKIAGEIWANGFSVPEEQELQVQLLEQFDEARVRDAMSILSRLLGANPPLKRAVFEQRLRRLEEHAEEEDTRDAARALRRQVRG